MIRKNDLFDYENRMIFQDTDLFKFSLDSILLAEYARYMEDNSNVLDLCSGNCAVPLICSTFNNCKYICFEISEKSYSLGVESIKYNNLDNQITLINDDINKIRDYYEEESFDYILCNPPYFKYVDSSHINTNYDKSVARHEIKLNLNQIFEIAFKMLKNKGTMYIVHRPDRLDDIINIATKNRINVKHIQLISSNKNDIPNIVLCKCVKNSNSGVNFGKFINVSNCESYKEIFKEE